MRPPTTAPQFAAKGAAAGGLFAPSVPLAVSVLVISILLLEGWSMAASLVSATKARRPRCCRFVELASALPDCRPGDSS